MSRQNLMD